MRLHHFTCDHGADGIRASGQLQPSLHTILRVHLLWLTPFATAKRAELGLTSLILSCDRMAHRFTVDTDDAVPWTTARISYDAERVSWLEAAPGAKPSLWWIARTPVAIT